MAKRRKPAGNPAAGSESRPYTGSRNQPLPSGNDPGGSRSKGYSADPDPAPERPINEEGDVPLASDADVLGTIKMPDKSHAVKPPAPHPYSPNDRLMGSDR